MTDSKSLIRRSPKTENTYQAVIENQGKWIYYLTKEGLDMGLTPQFAKDAMYELGAVYANDRFAECSTLHDFCDCLMGRAMVEGRSATATLDGGVLTVQIDYSPMYKLWSELTNEIDEKVLMHNVACEFYRGLAEKKGFSFATTAPDDARFGACTLTFRE